MDRAAAASDTPRTQGPGEPKALPHRPAITASNEPAVAPTGAGAPARVGSAPQLEGANQPQIIVLDREGIAPGSAALLLQGMRDKGAFDPGAPKNAWIGLALDGEIKSGTASPFRQVAEEAEGARFRAAFQLGEGEQSQKGMLGVKALRDGNGRWHLLEGAFRSDGSTATVPLAIVRDEGLSIPSLDWAAEHEDSPDGSQRSLLARAVYGVIDDGGFTLQPASRAGAPLQLRSDEAPFAWPEGHPSADHATRLVCTAVLHRHTPSANPRFDLSGAVLIDRHTGQAIARTCIAERLQPDMLAPESMALLRQVKDEPALTSEQVAQLSTALEAALCKGELKRLPDDDPDAPVRFLGQMALPGGEQWNVVVSVAVALSAELHLAGIRFENAGADDSPTIDMAKRLFPSVVAPASMALVGRLADDTSFEHRPVMQGLRDALAGDQLRKRSSGYSASVELPDGRKGKLSVSVDVGEGAELELVEAVFREEGRQTPTKIPLAERLPSGEVKEASPARLQQQAVDG